MGTLTKGDMTDSSEEFTLEEEALVRQWLEYRKVVLDRLNPQQPVPHAVFQELNNQLKNTSYLAGNKFSKADAELLSGIIEFYVSPAPAVPKAYSQRRSTLIFPDGSGMFNISAMKNSLLQSHSAEAHCIEYGWSNKRIQSHRLFVL